MTQRLPGTRGIPLFGQATRFVGPPGKAGQGTVKETLRESTMVVRARRVDGHVSFVLTCLLVVLALLPVPKPLESFATIVGLVVLGAAIVLGIRGIRTGQGFGKAGACLSLVILGLWALATLVLGGMQLVRSVTESRP